MDTRYVFSGYLKEGEYGENSSALLLIADPKSRDHFCAPLAHLIRESIGANKKLVTVRFSLTDAPVDDIDVVAANEIMKLDGLIDVDYHSHYSEITGYLWTDEELKIGGHDLIARLSGELRHWLMLEIITHDLDVHR